MTEHDREEEIRRRYRELAREEPPRALDDAILAAARRELETRPAPLVAPSGRRRWAVPIAAAAVIVLSAVVTLHVQREQPDAELAMQLPAPPAPQKDEQAAAASRVEVEQDKLAAQPGGIETYSYGEKREAAKLRAPERRRAAEPAPAKPTAPMPDLAGGVQPKPPADPGRFSPDPAPAAAPPVEAPQMQMRPAAPFAQPAPRAAESASAAAGPPPAVAEPQSTLRSLRDSARPREDAGALAKRAEPSESPERMLERIAALRREGRQKEADDLYAEFRKRFPDYRIPDALRDQVLPR
jgi:hypothetical protein